MQRPVPTVLVLVLAAALSGCSGGGGLSTSSILGSDPPTPPAAQAVAAPSDPTSRAFQVGSVSARAVKCGYNFDAARLKATYLSHETANGLPATELGKLEKVYDVAYSGVTKAAAEDPNYCSEQKTRVIKADLNRLLAGDFEPPKRVAQKQDDGGLFSGWFDGSSGGDSGPKFGSDAWWEKQKEATGN